MSFQVTNPLSFSDNEAAQFMFSVVLCSSCLSPVKCGPARLYFWSVAYFCNVKKLGKQACLNLFANFLTTLTVDESPVISYYFQPLYFSTTSVNRETRETGKYFLFVGWSSLSIVVFKRSLDVQDFYLLVVRAISVRQMITANL